LQIGRDAGFKARGFGHEFNHHIPSNRIVRQ
jgi:hypothetical protein